MCPHGATSHQTCPSKGFSLSTGPQVLPGACSSVAFHGVTASFGHPSVPVWGPPQIAGGHLLHCGIPWAAGEPLILKHPPSLLAHFGVCSSVSHIFSLFSLGYICAGGFSSSLIMLSQRQCYPH